MRRWFSAALLVALLVAADQASKFWVESALQFQQKVPLIPFLALFRTWNQGVAFSLLSSFGDTALIAITLAILGFVLFLWRQAGTHRLVPNIGFALITAGALGNLIDRIWFGHVVDFILFHTANWSFAVFNLADSFITLGAIALLLDELPGLGRRRKEM